MTELIEYMLIIYCVKYLFIIIFKFNKLKNLFFNKASNMIFTSLIIHGDKSHKIDENYFILFLIK